MVNSRFIASVVGTFGMRSFLAGLVGVLAVLVSARADEQGAIRKTVPQGKLVLIAAHRGGYSHDKLRHAPENSVANVAVAIEMGYDVFETDIQRTSDGVFVIVHDETIDRETNGRGMAKDMTLVELKKLKKRYRDGSNSDESVATLEELLSAGKGKIKFKPDLKPGVIDHFDELAILISKLGMSEQVFLRTGFRDAKIIKQHFDTGTPRVEVMFKTKNVAQVQTIIRDFHPETIQVNLTPGNPISDVQKNAIREAVKSGVMVETHIERDSSQWEQLADLGVRMFHTTKPDLALNFLKENGWRDRETR